MEKSSQRKNPWNSDKSKFGSKNTEVVVRQSVKNINKLTITERIAAAEEAKKTPDKKKK